MQDRLRNAGWRIQWIPWWEADKPEIIRPRNPLCLIGLALFLGVFFWNNYSFFGVTLSLSQVLIIAVSGLAIIMLGIILSACQIQYGWKQVVARCIDREISEYAREPGDLTSSWGYRLVCVFHFEGEEYKVTPEPSHVVTFNSKRQVQRYLHEKITDDGSCRLWINPENPLLTIFHKRRWWL